jgi:hypothetical protein
MKLNKNFIYLQFFSGVLFLFTAASFYSSENANLVPAFVSIGFALISIGFVLYGKQKKCS